MSACACAKVQPLLVADSVGFSFRFHFLGWNFKLVSFKWKSVGHLKLCKTWLTLWNGQQTSGFTTQGLAEVRQAQLLCMKNPSGMKVYRGKEQAFYQLKTGKNLGDMFLTTPKICSRGKKIFHWCISTSEPAKLSREKVAFQIHYKIALTNTVQSIYLFTLLY